MKRGTVLMAAAAITATLGLTVVATTSFAHGPGSERRAGMPMSGDMGTHHGMMGGHRARMFQMLDTDADGTVGKDEGRAAILEQLESFDADGDGTLSLDEFEKMHATHMRPMMVDRFQFHDDDGDGQVTAEEMTAPFAMMIRWMDRNGDGALSPDDMRGGRGEHRMGPMKNRQ